MPSATRWAADAAGKLIARIRSEGIGSAFRLVRLNLAHLLWRWRDSRFDRKYGVNTCGYVLGEDLKTHSPNKIFAAGYGPSSERVLKFIFARLSIAFEDYSFIDYGSGKGRALLIASEYPFERIIGVEFSPGFHEIAQDNIKRYRNKRQACFDLESVCIDAEHFEIPDTPCLIYMYDPFEKEVVKKVIDNIRESYTNNPRRLIIIYYDPVHREILDAADFLKVMDVLDLPVDKSLPKQYKVELYEAVA